MSDENDSVLISKRQYDQLIQDAFFLECLESAGVDNWDFYGDALERFQEEYPEVDE